MTKQRQIAVDTNGMPMIRAFDPLAFSKTAVTAYAAFLAEIHDAR